MPFFPGSGSGGSSPASSSDPRQGKYPYYISDTNSVPPGAQIAEFIADLNSYDTDGFPLEVDGENLTTWKSLNDAFSITPISGSTVQLKEDADGYRYLDVTGSADGLEIECDLLTGRDKPFTFIMVCEPQSLAANDTFVYGYDTGSANDTVELKLNSSLELQTVLTNEFGTANTTDGVYGGESVFVDQTKTILLMGHTGEKIYFGAGQSLGAFRYGNMEDSDNGGARVIDKISIGCRDTGTPDRFAQLKIYQIIIVSGHLYRATGHINALSYFNGVDLSKPSTKIAPAPSYAWWYSDNSTAHPDVRGSGYDFTTSGSLSNTGSGITISDTAVGSSSGGYITMTTPPPAVLATESSIFTFGQRIRTNSSFNAFDGLAGVSDGTNRHWEISVQSSGRIYFETWDSVGAKNNNPTTVLPVSEWSWVWVYIDRVNGAMSVAFNGLDWNSSTAISGSPSISSAPLNILKRDNSAGATFNGHIHHSWLFIGRILSKEERQLVMGTGYWHGGKPGEAVPIF